MIEETKGFRCVKKPGTRFLAIEISDTAAGWDGIILFQM